MHCELTFYPRDLCDGFALPVCLSCPSTSVGDLFPSAPLFSPTTHSDLVNSSSVLSLHSIWYSSLDFTVPDASQITISKSRQFRFFPNLDTLAEFSIIQSGLREGSQSWSELVSRMESIVRKCALLRDLLRPTRAPSPESVEYLYLCRRSIVSVLLPSIALLHWEFNVPFVASFAQ